MTASAEGRTHLACYLLLAVIGLVAYSNAPFGQYVYDDIPVIANNRAIDSPANAIHLFSKQYSPHFRELSYRPVVSLSYFIDALVFGRRAALSRLFNIFLHIGAAMSLFGLWWHLFGSRRVAFFSAATFVAHPIATEVVNSPGFREEILCLLLMVAAMHALMHALGEMDGRPSKRWAWLAGALWFLALLSKEPAVMMPVLFALALLRSATWRGVARLAFRVHRRTVFWAVLPLAAGLVVYGIMYLSFRYDAAPEAEPDTAAMAAAVQDWPGDRGPVLRVLNFTRSLLLYARLWVAPVGLSINHWFRPSDSLADWRLYAGLAGFLAFVAVCALAWRKRSEAAGYGAAWALVMFAPLTQVVPTPELVAERYVYLPHAGFSLLVATFVLRLGRQRGPALRGVWHGALRDWRRLALTAVIILFAALTWFRNRDWRDDVTLNMATYRQWKNAQGYLAMGALYYGQRDLRTAERYFKWSVQLDHHNSDAYRNLALIALEKRDLDLARYHLEASKRLVPSDPRTKQAFHILRELESETEDSATSPSLRVSPRLPRSPFSAP